jgi:hypothetical protein
VSGVQTGVDHGVLDAAHAAIVPVESLAVTLKFERVLLGRALRYRRAIMYRILGLGH